MTVIKRMRVEIEGALQGEGVDFRPFIFRLAGRHGISGWVCNSDSGLVIEAEGLQVNLDAFLLDIELNPPSPAFNSLCKSRKIAATGQRGFLILPSLPVENGINCRIDPDYDFYDNEALQEWVVRVFQQDPLFLQASPGCLPRAISLTSPQKSVLAVGGELNNGACLTKGSRAFLSRHADQLNATQLSAEDIISHLSKVLTIEPVALAHDLHPDYLSTCFGAPLDHLPRIAVQHHHAHMASCMADNGIEGEVIGVVLDDAGFGLDGNIWGGEFLLGTYRSCQRKGHFRYIPMPGGDAAVREPLRMAIAYLYDYCGAGLFSLGLPCLEGIRERERHLYLRMLEERINTPLTSSCGRLFDAVAALVRPGERPYGEQAAKLLETLAEQADEEYSYPYAIFGQSGSFQLDFRLTIGAILLDRASGETPQVIARRFHETVATAGADLCAKIRRESGVGRVVLSGELFGNKLLTARLHHHLAAQKFKVFTHQVVPPGNDGLALGQAVIAGQSIR